METHSQCAKHKALEIYFVDNLLIFIRPGSGRKEMRIDNIKRVTDVDREIVGSPSCIYENRS